MSMPLAIENPRADARQPFGRAPSDMVRRLRTAILRVALIGLVAMPLPARPRRCRISAGHRRKRRDRQAQAMSENFRAGTRMDCRVYLFPTIYVIGKRTAD